MTPESQDQDALDSAASETLESSASIVSVLPGKPAEKIERVIDVPLAVTLRFGQRHLTLREVLALTTGSLVELDRQVEEPVELVLGDRLIARGEVVVVDGNYGLRVIEVIEGAAHRLERVQTAVAAQQLAAEGGLRA